MALREGCKLEVEEGVMADEKRVFGEVAKEVWRGGSWDLWGKYRLCKFDNLCNLCNKSTKNLPYFEIDRAHKTFVIQI